MTRVDVKQGVMDITVSLTALDCAACSIVFAVPDRLNKERRGDGGTFYCPNGHPLTYGKSAADKLRAELQDARRDIDWYKTAERAAADRAQTAERSAAAYKGQTTKLRKRALTGTCAFCHRHFANVERHVASKHPTEQAES